MHADLPGDRPRLLYWYRTAPGIVQGRSALDEEAIRTIEEQHPDIEFDWPAILALAEVMTPEEEAPARPPQRQGRRQRGRDQKPQGPRRGEGAGESAPASADAAAAEADQAVDQTVDQSDQSVEEEPAADAPPPIEIPPPSNRLVEELAGREIGARLRARYADVIARIQDLDVDGSVKDEWFKRAEVLDPETWMTPEQVLEGVRNADAQYETLRAALQS
jgi:hypothetical protein